MRSLKYALGLAAALAITAGGASAALADSTLQNEMESDLMAVYCADEQGATTEVTGELAAGASVTVSPDKLPEYGCSRLAVLIDSEEGWQFYHEPEPAGASEIIFSLDRPNPQLGVYPSLLIVSGDESYVAPAGIPLSMLAQHMQFGLDEAKWREISTPGLDPAENTEFAISFADQSWSLANEGMEFKELAAGQNLAASIGLETEFSNTTVTAALLGLRDMGLSPLLFIHNGQEQSVSQDSEHPWPEIGEMLAQAAVDDGGTIQMLFGSDTFTTTLTLDLDSAVAMLAIERKEGAPLG
ncbi:MAG: hypothetical protein LBV79_02655 [Candidatus Adiutrix sp.]|jgi:hypothetical protein|nr:hypothetical protein [Candidatus Adiutrix sp.]